MIKQLLESNLLIGFFKKHSTDEIHQESVCAGLWVTSVKTENHSIWSEERSSIPWYGSHALPPYPQKNVSILFLVVQILLVLAIVPLL